MKCIFSNEETNTQEHVIPRWLQKRMNLSEEKLFIPNGTNIRYKHLVIPAQKTHNEKFGEIENRISKGIFKINEVYLWALKIHIGLLYKDSNLKFDITKANSKNILNIGDFFSEVTLFQYLYKIWLNKGSTNPEPFGSVFIFDSLTPDNFFDFVHCFVTSSIGIDIGSKFIFVSFWDRARLLNSNVEALWHESKNKILNKYHNAADCNLHYMMASRIWAFETAYFAYLDRKPISFISCENSIILSPYLKNYKPRVIDDNELNRLCHNFGLERVNMPEIGKYAYTQFKKMIQ